MNTEKTKILMTLKEACRETGYSVYYLRSGCKAGTVPHVMSGNRYLVNVPLLIEQLNEESRGVRDGQGADY